MKKEYKLPLGKIKTNLFLRYAIILGKMFSASKNGFFSERNIAKEHFLFKRLHSKIISSLTLMLKPSE